MLTLSPTDFIAASCSTNSAVSYSIFGDSIVSGVDTFALLAQGQLSTTPGTILAASTGTRLVKTITLTNTTASIVGNIKLFVNGTNAGNQIITLALPAFGSAKFDSSGWAVYNSSGSLSTFGLEGRGISSIDYTSTVGLTDTYTITYTDFTTSTFEVYSGEQGDPAGYLYQFSNITTNSDPGPAEIRFNNSVYSNVTEIYIDIVSGINGRGFYNLSAEILSWDDSTSTVKSKLYIRPIENYGLAEFAYFNILGVTDNSGYYTLSVSYVHSIGTLVNGNIYALQIFRTGDKGQAGDVGAAGQSSYSTTVGNFTQPASGANVSVNAVNVSWTTPGSIVYIDVGGYYKVITIGSPTNFTLQNLGYPGNATPGTTIASGSLIVVGGLQGAQGPAGTGGVALAAGTQTATSGTISFANSNGVSFGLSGSSQLTASVRTDYAGTNFAGTNVSGTVNTNGVSLSVNAQTTQAQSFSLAGNTSGNSTITGNQIFLQGGNNVTLSGTNNTIVISGASFRTDYAGTNFAGTNVSATLNTSGLSLSVAPPDGINRIAAGTQTAGTNTTVLFANSNGISFGMSGSSQITASYTVPTQTTQAQSFSLTGNTSGNSTVTGNQIFLQGGNNVTLSGTSNTIVISGATFRTDYAGTNFAGTNVSGTVNTNGISLSVAAGGAAANTFALSGNTSGNSTVTGNSVVFQGGNNITLSGTSNTIVISGATFRTDYAGTNFAGTNISGTLNTNGASLSVAAQTVQAQSFSLTGNTAGNSTVTGNQIFFQGGDNITLSGTNNTIVISAAAGGGGGAAKTYGVLSPPWALPLKNVAETNLTAMTNRPILFPLDRMAGPSVYQGFVLLNMSRSTSGSNAFTLHIGIYEHTFNANGSGGLTLLTSFSNLYSNTSTAGISGLRQFIVSAPASMSLPAGQLYGAIMPVAAATLSANYSLMGAGLSNNVVLNAVGGGTNVTQLLQDYDRFHGRFSVTTASLPSSFAIGAISGGTNILTPNFTLR